jgi:hypothetical protein
MDWSGRRYSMAAAGARATNSGGLGGGRGGRPPRPCPGDSYPL